MNIQELPGALGGEAIFRVTCARSGLDAFIAIHRSRRGPAVGGIRHRRYPSADAAR